MPSTSSSYSNFIEPKSFVRVRMVQEDESDRCTKLGDLRFRPQHRLGECSGCKGVCEECENLLLWIDEHDDKTNYSEWTRAELDEHNRLNPQAMIECQACDDCCEDRYMNDASDCGKWVCNGGCCAGCCAGSDSEDDFDERDCECGNNREKGYDPKGNMRCEDCDIDGPNYNGGLTEDEDEDEAYEKRIEALGTKPDDGDKYFICDHLVYGDCKNPVWTREGGLKRNDQDLWLCSDCFVGDMGTEHVLGSGPV